MNKSKNRGFSLIWLVFIVSIVGVTLAFSPLMNEDGVCKFGYKFAGRDSRSVQIINSEGHGIPCEMK